MRRLFAKASSFWALTAALAVAQSEMRHYDGTTEFTSRGATGTDAKTLLQRIPGDQHGSNNTVVAVRMILQDQNALTTEIFTLELRGNDPAGPPTGQPNMGAGGLLGSAGPFDVLFPCPSGACAALFTFSGLAIPVPDGPSVPGGDFYTALATPAEPGWTGDGVSCHISAALSGLNGEQQNPGAIGYTGAAGISGLGWDANTTTGAIALGSGNRSWNMATQLMESVAQPFADNPAVFTGVGGNGANPNFGYAGIFPFMARAGGPDGMGVRVRTNRPVGTPVCLVIGASLFGACANIFASGPGLCIAPPYIISPVVLTAPPTDAAAAISEAIFGPAAGNVAFAGAQIYVQGFMKGPNELTCLCRIQL